MSEDTARCFLCHLWNYHMMLSCVKSDSQLTCIMYVTAQVSWSVPSWPGGSEHVNIRCVVALVLSPRSGRLQSIVSLLFVNKSGSTLCWTLSHLTFVPSRVEAALMRRLTSQSVSVLIKICVDYLYFGSWLEGAYHLPFTSPQPPLPLHAWGKQEAVNMGVVLWSESALCWRLGDSTVLNTMFRIHITHEGLNPSIVVPDVRLFRLQTMCVGCRTVLRMQTDSCWPLVNQADVSLQRRPSYFKDTKKSQ